MATDNIIKLRVDSKEFDNKIKSANDGLNLFFSSLKKFGKSVADANIETLKYVRELGNFETKTQSAKAKVNEMSKAYIDLRSQYLNLTDTEKASPFGQAMSASLDKLQSRIVAAKKELNEIGKEIGNLPTGAKDVGGSDFSGLLTGLDSAIQASSSGVSGMLGLLGKFGPQAAAIGGISTAIIGLGSSAIEARKNIENLQLNLGTLLGSAEKGKNLVKELQNYGVATPYDTAGLANAAQTMLAYGVQAQNIMPLMRELGDVAMGDAQKLSSLALAFGQMTAVGTVQKQDLNQMANAGFGFNQIAESMHVTVAEFLDMVSKKKVSVEDIAKALHEATSEGGLFYNSAVNASKGLEGTFSNFEEALTNTKAQLGELVEPAVLEIVQALGDSIEGLTQGLGGSSEAAEIFKTIGGALGEAIKKAGGEISDVISIAKAFKGIIAEIGETISPVIDTVEYLAGGVDGLQGAFGNVNSNPFVQAVRNLFNPLGTLRNQLETLLAEIRNARKELLGDTAEEFTNRRGGNNYTPPKRRPVKAGDEIKDSTYYYERYGSVKNGKWYFNDNGARVYNQNNPVPKEKPKTDRTKSADVGKQNKQANLTRSEITKKINNLTDEYVNASAARKKAILGEINSLNQQKKKLDKVAAKGGNHTKTVKKPKSTTPKTEEQLNTEQINKLSQEYVSATDTRRAAIRDEIKTLQDRNDEIKKLKEEAQGKVALPVDPESLKGLNDELSKLKANQNLSKTNEEWTEWQSKIDAVKKKISEISEVKPDLSGLTTSNVAAFISDLQKQIQQAPIGSELYEQLTGQMRNASTFQDLIANAIKNGINPNNLGDLSGTWTQILAGDSMDTALQAMVDKINEKLAELDLPELNIDNNTGKLISDGKDMASSWQKAGQAIQGVGSAMSQIEDPAARVAGTIAQAIASIALGAGEAMAQGGKLGPWGWIAAAAAITATMVSTIATVRSATSHAQGGLIEGGTVGGNSYSGDRVVTRLNSGELVLNRAQQGNLASQLESGNGGYGSGMSYVSGENIYIALNAYMRRRGIGEIAAFKFK